MAFSDSAAHPSRRRRWFAASGAVLLAAGVAVAAWSAHGAGGVEASRLSSAALHLLVHGLGLLALDRGHGGWLPTLAMAVLLAGTLLFSGTLVAAVAFGTGTASAPFGGILTMLGWLLAAVALLRR